LDKLRFGIIGAGGIGGSHLRVIEKRDDAEVAVVCDTSEDVRDRFAAEGYAVTAEWSEVIAGDIDAVVVALPHYLYPEVVSAALAAGKHVLQEKPFAHNLAAARQTVTAAERSEAVLMVGGQSKYQAGFQRAKEVAETGVLGDVFMIRGVITYRWGNAFAGKWSWRGRRELSGGTAIIDSGWHILELMNWFSGVPQAVYATTGHGNALPGDYDVDDRAVMAMEYENGAIGVATISFICLPGERTLTLHGTEGSMQISDNEVRLHTGPQKDAEVITLAAAEDSLGPQMGRFIELVRTGGDGMPGVLAALDVQRVIEAAYMSAAGGKRVMLEEV